VGNTKHWAKW